jgi:hypothetical protein
MNISSSTQSINNQSNNIITLLHHRQYGLINHKSILSSIFHTPYSLLSVHKRKSSLSNLIKSNQKKLTSRKRTVSENDENHRDNNNDEKTSKRLCRSSEWIFENSQLTLFKSISTIDNRTSIINEQQTNYLLSKSDGYLSNNHHHHHRRYSSDKQQTIDTLSTLVLSQ